MYARGNSIDAAGEAKEVESFVLLADCVLGVDLCDIVVALLDGLPLVNNAFYREKRFTFLTLSFSVFSSLPALAACLFSCFAVNCDVLGGVVGQDKAAYL